MVKEAPPRESPSLPTTTAEGIRMKPGDVSSSERREVTMLYTKLTTVV
jgi:hypothetical protein